MNTLTLIEASLRKALNAITDARTTTALFQPMVNMGDETAADLIADKVGDASTAIMDCYKEIGKHAPTLTVIIN